MSEEETIKILKQFDEEIKECDEIIDEFDPYNIPFKHILIRLKKPYYDIFNTILDLYQQEKEKNKYLSDREKYLEGRRTEIINMFQNEVTETTIPKNKIKEKIEELEKLIQTNSLHEECWNKIEVLKELLEEE